MADTNQEQLGNTPWGIADPLRGAMDADDYRDSMLSFLFLRHLFDNHEASAKQDLTAAAFPSREEVATRLTRRHEDTKRRTGRTSALNPSCLRAFV
jgi:type I restriction enzyme M protein